MGRKDALKAFIRFTKSSVLPQKLIESKLIFNCSASISNNLSVYKISKLFKYVLLVSSGINGVLLSKSINLVILLRISDIIELLGKYIFLI